MKEGRWEFIIEGRERVGRVEKCLCSLEIEHLPEREGDVQILRKKLVQRAGG